MNAQEPQWRVGAHDMRTEFAQGKMPYEFHEYAYAHGEEGRMLLPSREPPHHCKLGKLLSSSGTVVKPPGSHRRPWGCLCYPTDAPRLPNNTLVNKFRDQAVRHIHLGYSGGRCGSFETTRDVERCQPGYICFEPESNSILITESVRFVPDVFPGLQRRPGGGWRIPTSEIPFIADNNASDKEQSTSSGLIDVNDSSFQGSLDASDADEIQLLPGFPPEDESPAASPDPISQPEPTLPPVPDVPAPKTKPVYLLPHARYPDYTCNEHNGEGWDVHIVERKGQWAKCKFIHARDEDGKEWHPEWEPYEMLLKTDNRNNNPVDQETDKWGPTTEENTTLTPNQHTLPAPGFDNLQDPVRPQRARKQPDWFSSEAARATSIAAFAGMHAESTRANMDVYSPFFPTAGLAIDMEGASERMLNRAVLAGVVHGDGDEVQFREEFDSMDLSLQQAAMISADHSTMCDEYGSTSPQAKCAREIYAAHGLAAAQVGKVIPFLDPLYHTHDDSNRVVAPSDMFDDEFSSHIMLSSRGCLPPDIMAAAKAKSSPLDYTEREMTGPEWDPPKDSEVAKLKRMESVSEIAADDPSIKHMKVVPTMWVGRDKLNPDNSLCKKNARCVERGDIHCRSYTMTANQCFSPTVRNSSMHSCEAVSCLRGQNMCRYDVPGAYLQGVQKPEEQVLLRPPPGYRRVDERGVEILWITNHPLYGQGDAGAIWNRTMNQCLESECKLPRCPQEPCVYSAEFGTKEAGRVNHILYVDDGRLYYDNTASARKAKDDITQILHDRFGVEMGPENPEEDYFLGANRTSVDRHVATVRATTYIRTMVERYIPDGDIGPNSKFPAHWSYSPADETLTKAWDAAVATRTPGSKSEIRRYQELFGSLLHVVKYRPEIACAMGKLGSCMTFPTDELYQCMMRVLIYLARSPRMGTTFSAHTENAKKLVAYADSDWGVTRSTTGFVIFLCGAIIAGASRRQHCISMSSTEAELNALAECAIELLHESAVTQFMGLEVSGPIQVHTDNKGAYDLCHRFSAAQHSRHIDRKMFKMRELRGAGVVEVNHVPTESNPADLFTKILSRQPFERHRKTILNLAGDTGVEFARRQRMSGKDPG